MFDLLMSTLTQPANRGVVLPLSEIDAFCRRWKIVRLELFGSATRGELTANSDLDFLFTLADDARWGWNFVDACDELEAIVGRAVDLVSRRSIERSANPYRKQSILSSTELIYER
jgi:predicted nucleotidyltransferase